MSNGTFFGGAGLQRFAMAARAGAPAPAGASADFRAAWSKLASGATLAQKPGGGWVEFAPPVIRAPEVSPSGFAVPELAKMPVPIPGIVPSPQPNNIPWITPAGRWETVPPDPVINVPIALDLGPNVPLYGPGGGIYNPLPGGPPSPRTPGGPFTMPGQFRSGVPGGMGPWGAPGVTSPRPTWDQVAVATGAVPSGGGGAPAPGGAPALSFAAALDPKNLLKYGAILGGIFIVYNMGKSNKGPRRSYSRRRPRR
jgi:hypothetical protein